MTKPKKKKNKRIASSFHHEMTKIWGRQLLLVTPPSGKIISSKDHFVILITKKLDTYLLWDYAK
jgi:hypothetical protein